MTDPARLEAAPVPANDDTGAREAGRWVEPLLLAARHLGLSVSPEARAQRRRLVEARRARRGHR